MGVRLTRALGSSVIAVVLAAPLLASCGSSAKSPTPTTAPITTTAPTASTSGHTQTPTAHPCHLSVSSIELAMQSGDGLALQLVYRNTRAASCTVRGYPKVMTVGIPIKALTAVPQATAGSLGTTVPVQTVTLAAGMRASALIEWSQSSHVSARSCGWVGYVMTRPPGSAVWTRVGSDGLGRVCDAHVLPVTAGTSHNGYVLAPRSHTTLGLVVTNTKLAHGYRVVLAPAMRQADGQFVAIPGRATVTYVIPDALVPDGITLLGPIVVTARGMQVTALTIVGG